MKTRVLVTYASKRGSTAEMAEAIGQVLSEAGLAVDVVAVKDVDGLAPYEAVVLGSAVYMFRWRREAVQFLERHEQALAERDVWLFCSGPTDVGDPEELLEGKVLPAALQPVVARIGPHDVAVFHGVMDVEKLSFWERWIINRVDAPAGDFRDWEMIRAWAAGIAETLQGVAVAGGRRR